MEEKKAAAVPSFDAKDVEENKGMAALSYIGLLFLVPMLAKKDSKFAQAHAKQGMVLFIAVVIVSFIAWIPVIGWLLGVAAVVIMIMGVVNTLQGKYWPIPLLHDLTTKFNL